MKILLIRSARLRRLLGILLPFALIPAVVIWFALGPARGHYALSSLLVTIMALILFSCGFERRKTGSRRMILVAVMTALSVAGRFVFAALPFFKPITAMVIITAIYVGPEAGFLTGALSAVISNFYFGQGPWTPFQMLSWGLLGLFAGLLSRPLKQSRLLLSLYGVLAGTAYSLIMDVWTVMWYNGSLNAELYAAALAAALPVTLMYAISNVIFVNLLARPFGEKLERVKIKYGV